MSCVVPHFSAFPLRAKKRRNFELWMEAAKLITSKPCRSWTNEQLSRMRELREEIKGLNSYKEAP